MKESGGLPDRRSSATATEWVWLTTEAEQPEQDDQAKRHSEQPQQDQDHLSLPPLLAHARAAHLGLVTTDEIATPFERERHWLA
jgi:hypothetical protein